MRHYGRNGQRRYRPSSAPLTSFYEIETAEEIVERMERNYPPVVNGSATRRAGTKESMNYAPQTTFTDRAAPTNQPTASWDNPELEILEEARGSLPDFPDDVFSAVWRDFVQRASHAAGVTVAHVAGPLLSAVSGLIGCSYRIKAANAWLEPCAVWVPDRWLFGHGQDAGH